MKLIEEVYQFKYIPHLKSWGAYSKYRIMGCILPWSCYIYPTVSMTLEGSKENLKDVIRRKHEYPADTRHYTIDELFSEKVGDYD